jgi:hypothetical protein
LTLEEIHSCELVAKELVLNTCNCYEIIDCQAERTARDGRPLRQALRALPDISPPSATGSDRGEPGTAAATSLLGVLEIGRLKPALQY